MLLFLRQTCPRLRTFGTCKLMQMTCAPEFQKSYITHPNLLKKPHLQDPFPEHLAPRFVGASCYKLEMPSKYGNPLGGMETYHSASEEQPSAELFAQHYADLLNPESQSQQLENFEVSAFKYMPILDDMIQPHELLHCLKSLKQNKAGGVDGVPPWILKLLSDDWLVLLTHLFNTVFDHG